MTSNIFIPKKLNVGFQNRNDTYTKKLAYVIYYDEKGKLRKQASWESWRDKKIDPIEYDNEPTEGFVLNKNVGGYAYHWDARKSYIRVFDPRGFEFEITLPNLLYILENTNSIKGKGLDGKFVYGWDGKDLVLIPVESPEYKQMQEMTTKLYASDTIKPGDLKVGCVYLTAKGERYVFMGNHTEYTYRSNHIGSSTTQQEINEWIKEGYCRDNTDPNSTKYTKTFPSSRPKVWLVRLYTDGRAEMVVRSTASKMFYEQEGTTPHKDYHIFEKALNECQNYCPIDFNMTEYPLRDINEFRKILEEKWARALEKQWYEDYHYYTKNSNGYPIAIAVKFRGQKKTIHRTDTSSWRSYCWGDEYPTNIDELCDIYPPIDIKIYLQNKNKTEARHIWRLLDGYKE